jgi:outer membrane protein assembly factor BamD (BamD/ComL family)
MSLLRSPALLVSFTLASVSALGQASESAWRAGADEYATRLTALGIDLKAGEAEMMGWAKAVRDFQAHRYDQADSALQRVLERHPASHLADDALWMLAQIDLAQGRSEQGIERLQRLLRDYRDPDWFQEVTRRLVDELRKAGREDEAKEQAAGFVAMWPDTRISPWLRQVAGLEGTQPADEGPANEHWAKIVSYRDKTRWLGEEVLLKEHLRRFPASPHLDEVRSEQMRLSRNHLMYSGAEERLLTKLLRTQAAFPQMDLAYVRLAYLRLEEGRADEGAALLEQMVEAWPNSQYAPRALIDAGLARLTVGQRSQALAELKKAEGLTFDPYYLRDIALAREYAQPGVDWARALDEQHRAIESPETTIGARAEAQSRAAVLHRLVPPNRDPAKAAVWKVRLFIFTGLDHEWQTKDGEDRHTVAHMTRAMLDDVQNTFKKYKEDVFRLSRGSVRIESETHILDENAQVNKVDWNKDNPDLFWNKHGHPMEQLPKRDTGPFQSDFWVLPCQGLPVWAPAGAGGVEKETGRANVSFHYSPTWKDWLRPVFLHEWLHTVDSGFWMNGWQPQYNLAHTHSGRDWFSGPPAEGDPEWAIGYVKCVGEPTVDWFDFYRHMVSVMVTPRMWQQARLDGIKGDQGATLYELAPLP